MIDQLLRHLPSRLAGLVLAASLCVSMACSSHRPAQAETAAIAPAALTQNPGALQPPPAAPAPATQPVQAEAQTPPSNIVPAPSNIRAFAPDESAVASAIPADKVDLRKIFEDLGPDATLWYQHVQTLSNPFFEGRAPGTHGGEVAADYLEFFFRMYGLEPAFPGEIHQLGSDAVKAFTSFRQPFDFASPNPDVRVLEAAGSLNGEPLTEGADFAVLGNSGSGQVTAPVTFVGYGITEGKDGYTSFEEKTDLTGRIALLLRYEPLNEDGKSQWSSARFSPHSGIAAKMKNLADRGAAGVILVNPPGAVDGKTGLETLKDSGRFGKRMAVPVVQVTPEIADRIMRLGDTEKRDLMAWRRLADTGEINTVNLDDSVKVALVSKLDVHDRLNTQNVAAVLRGKGSLADQWIVIGGHFDHLGYGYTGTMPANAGRLHPGADDNASGTAGVLIAARRFSKAYEDAADTANLRSILFIAFSAEEAGLIGSKYFVDHPPITADSTSLMINMDMIGRLRSNNLLVQGAGTAEGLADLLKPHYDSSGLKISVMPGGRGPSDHSSFYGAKIPVLFLFTGEHRDYHQPSDRGYTVNPAGALKIIELLEAIVMDVAARPEKLKFTTTTQGGGGGRDTGAKVSLGTMPDYAAELETGMKVEGVRDGSSAALAGIQAGDILLTWNGKEIGGPRNLSEFLAKHEPGDKVKIMLRRGDQELTAEVTLQARAVQ